MFPGGLRLVERERAWARSCDIVFAVSETTRTDVLQYIDVPSDRVVTTPLGVRQPRRHNDHRGDPTLLYVGGRPEYKNWLTLVRSLMNPDLRDVRLVCVGGDWTKAELAVLHELGVCDRLTRRTAVDAKLSELYCSVAALVCPSLYEGFGLPVLEAMAHACPTVCADTGSMPEIAGESAVYFDPTDPEDIARCLIAVAGNQQVQRSLGSAGLARAAEYTWDRTASLTARSHAEIAAT
jgi:glycosyltransferase involved in cell wall biosynthesis